MKIIEKNCKKIRKINKIKIPLNNNEQLLDFIQTLLNWYFIHAELNNLNVYRTKCALSHHKKDNSDLSFKEKTRKRISYCILLPLLAENANIYWWSISRGILIECLDQKRAKNLILILFFFFLFIFYLKKNYYLKNI